MGMIMILDGNIFVICPLNRWYDLMRSDDTTRFFFSFFFLLEPSFSDINRRVISIYDLKSTYKGLCDTFIYCWMEYIVKAIEVDTNSDCARVVTTKAHKQSKEHVSGAY